ncbi:hypothetical protein [Acidicapsa acidisoli]|uniref:hypothetical protein n=1 Tax=Acidicapsa acidisoli TaxID=1615681 RepID=UPI0021E07B01|nr:hypothetical protein [Acidicapsa acidisoli]
MSTISTTTVYQRVVSYPRLFGTAQRFERFVFGVFGLLLGLVTWRHEMFHDELQAWLIARDSPTLSALFHNLRYEGHPALWHLLLYIPAHISGNPVSMQVLNYLLALAQGWLILSARRIQWYLLTLAAFSFFVFYGYGAVARNYMLAMLLLTAAARCFLSERPRRWMGIVLLVLAIQAHFFAIPIAAVIFFWLYCFPDAESLARPARLLRSGQFWVALALLLASLIAAYFTVRPPADIFTPAYTSGKESLAGYFLICEGRAWQAFFPIPGSYIPRDLLEVLVPRHHPSAVAALLSLAVFLFVAATLRTARARYFFLCAAFLDLVAFAATVHFPPVRHYGLIFASLVIALFIDTLPDSNSGQPGRSRSSWLPNQVRTLLLVCFLGIQTMAALVSAGLDVLRPYSEAKATSQWLQRSGLANNPMVIRPDYAGVGLIGYLQRPSAYYTTCRCFESFVVWNTQRDEEHVLDQEDLNRVRETSTLPTLVIMNAPLPDSTREGLRLHLIQSFDQRPIYPDERFFIYQEGSGQEGETPSGN